MAVTSSGPIVPFLIKEVDKNYTVQSHKGEILVVLDAQGQIYMQRPSGLNLFKSYRYFVVDTVGHVSFSGFLCALRQGAEITKITAEYQVMCYPKYVQRYIKAAHQEGFVNDMIQRQIQVVVEDYHKSHDLTTDFGHKKPSVETLINERLEAMGLSILNVSISLEGGGKTLESLNIKVDTFKVGVLGCIPKASIGVDAVVITKTGSEARSINKTLTVTGCEEMIIKLIRNHISNNITADDLYHNYHSTVKQKLIQLINEALLEYGRVLEDLSLYVHKNGSLDPIVLKQEKYLDGRIRNSYQQIQIKYSCELVADPKLHARVYLFPANTIEMEEVIKDQIKETLANEINAEQFANELNTTVSARLAAAINLKISSWGRRMGFFQLQTDPSKAMVRNISINLNIDCQTKDGYDITVKNTLLLQWDAGSSKVFEATQVGALEEWGREQLERSTRKFIINHTYNELRFIFSDEQLRVEMQQEAEKIGYEVNQLIVIPEFQGEGPIERISLTYKDVNISSKVDDVPVAITIGIEGRITDYSKILKLIAPKGSVTEHIEKAIDNKMRQFFHAIHPERFYNRFYKKSAEKGDLFTLEEEIKLNIAELLSEDYGIELSSISAGALTTRLMMRLKQVLGGILECRYTDKTARFDYKSKINLLGVDEEGWATFTIRGYNLRNEDAQDTERMDIVRHIREYLESDLDTRVVPLFKQKVIKYHEDFVAEIKAAFPKVIEQVKNIFGLSIDILDPVKIAPESEVNKHAMGTKIEIEIKRIDTEKNLNSLLSEQRQERLKLLYTQLNNTDKDGYAAVSLTRDKIIAEIKDLEGSFVPSTGAIEFGNPFEALPPAKEEKGESEDNPNNNNSNNYE